MTALIIGATGLVGGHCLRLLLADEQYTQVIALVRRPLSLSHSRLQTIVVDFDRLDSCAADIKADVIFSTLGTTIKKAGSSAKFIKVDYEYQVKVAEIAQRNGAKTFVLLSSIGADKKSVILYTRVKGEVEEAITRLCYNYHPPPIYHTRR
jgi:nucleoside-diphosphate-sugar epimerase